MGDSEAGAEDRLEGWRAGGLEGWRLLLSTTWLVIRLQAHPLARSAWPFASHWEAAGHGCLRLLIRLYGSAKRTTSPN
jgi:hypothetical protein